VEERFVVNQGTIFTLDSCIPIAQISSEVYAVVLLQLGAASREDSAAVRTHWPYAVQREKPVVGTSVSFPSLWRH
jgi:hypothetical protein